MISLFGFAPDERPAGRFDSVDGIAALPFGRAPATHLRRLSARFELVWCTGWEERANEYLPMPWGYPGRCPYLAFDRQPGPRPRHWKLDAIDAYAGRDRPLAWIDDAHDGLRAWARERERARPCSSTPSPPTGITAATSRELGALGAAVHGH